MKTTGERLTDFKANNFKENHSKGFTDNNMIHFAEYNSMCEKKEAKRYCLAQPESTRSYHTPKCVIQCDFCKQ